MTGAFAKHVSCQRGGPHQVLTQVRKVCAVNFLGQSLQSTEAKAIGEGLGAAIPPFSGVTWSCGPGVLMMVVLTGSPRN
jgi:hypothetical protein